MSEFLDLQADFRDSHGKITSDEFVKRSGIPSYVLTQSLHGANHPDLYIQGNYANSITLIIKYRLEDKLDGERVLGKKTVFWDFMISAFTKTGYRIRSISVEELGNWEFILEGSRINNEF